MKHNTNPYSTFYGKLLYDQVVPEDHDFRLLLITINWNRIRNKLMIDKNGEPINHSPYGRPAYDPLVIFKLLFLQRWHPASDIKVEERAKTDLAYRFFLQLPIPEPIPDESTISRYRSNWGDEVIENIFNELFKQIQEFGLGSAKEGIVGDLTHQHARIQKFSARVLILTCFEKWMAELKALHSQFPNIFNQEEMPKIFLEIEAWFVNYTNQIKKGLLSKGERFSLLIEQIFKVQTFVNATLTKIEHLSDEIRTSSEWIRFFQRRQTLLQILDENVSYPDQEKQNDGKKRKQKNSKEKKSDQNKEKEEEQKYKQKTGDRKIISLTDTEARSGYKTKTKRFTGYKAAVSMTQDGFFSSVETVTGNEPDMKQAVPIVEKTIAVTGEIPQSAAFDLGMNSIANRQELHRLGVQPGIEFERAINSRNPDKFTKNDFIFDFEGLIVSCPAKQTTSKIVSSTEDNFIFKFNKKICDSCPLKDSCTTSKSGRTVSFTKHSELVEADNDYLQTEEYEKTRRLRWNLEGGFGEAKRAHGLATTPYKGRKKTSIHNRMVFIVMNAKRLLKALYSPGKRVTYRAEPVPKI